MTFNNLDAMLTLDIAYFFGKTSKYFTMNYENKDLHLYVQLTKLRNILLSQPFESKQIRQPIRFLS